MPRSSSKASKAKSLPPLPLPIAAPHAGTSASAALPPYDNPAADAPSSPSTARARITNGCIRTTVTLLVFGAYLLWTWPWHREHGFEGLPWRSSASVSAVQVQAEEVGVGVEVGAEVGVGVGVDVGTDGEEAQRPRLGVPAGVQAKWGQYAPYRAMGAYGGAPGGCRVTQVSRGCCLSPGEVLGSVWGTRGGEATRHAAPSMILAARASSGGRREYPCGVLGCANRAS